MTGRSGSGTSTSASTTRPASPRPWPRGSGPSSGTGARPSWKRSATTSGRPSRRSGPSSDRSARPPEAWPPALQTLRPRELAVEPDAVRLRVSLDLPPAPPVPTAPERALTRAEIQQWEALLDSWDGFLGFLVKDVAGSADPETRTELLDLLLTARREVTAVLGRGPEVGVDPIRPLFLRFWDRLRAIVRRAGSKGSDDARALRFVVFLAAGDALTAIEAAAPSAGLDFSADGLRRLARTLAPGYPGDPLEYSDAPDPKLQELFRFRDPDGPARRIRRKPGAAPLVAPVLAHVPARRTRTRPTSGGSSRSGWIAGSRPTSELAAYREIVDRLLTLAAERSFDAEALGDRFEDLFQDLVKAVAWQESCWRQFVRDRSGIVPIQSSTGDFGMMQINVRVWRGFFNPVKLRWNAGYNAGAGTEILWQLLGRYGSARRGNASPTPRARRTPPTMAARDATAATGQPDTPPEMRLDRPGVLGEVPGHQRRSGGGPRPLHARETRLLSACGRPERRRREIGRSLGAASTRWHV